MPTKFTKIATTLSLAVCFSITSTFAFSPAEIKAMYPDIEAYKKDEAQWLEKCEKVSRSREIAQKRFELIRDIGKKTLAEVNRIHKEIDEIPQDCMLLIGYLKSKGYEEEAQALDDVTLIYPNRY